MAGKSTISITFKLDGDGKGFKELSADADGLKKVISSAVSEAQALNTEAINFAAIASSLDAMQRSFQELLNGMQDLADAYAVQEVAETKLAVIMQQRMGATQAEIQSIKDLTSAQQELGVIGDEVQLSGAQQIATFLTEADSLEVLIPAMNNLLAQQKGLNATTQDAVTVGNLMGKVMQGQTSALTRVGITFSEAEEKVLKYGTESERAAMLSQVITNNVGEMNAALAQTENGKQQQLVNTLGDMKETLGSMVNAALPFVTIAAHALTALTNITTLTTGVKKAAAAIAAFNIKGKAMSIATRLMGVDATRTAVVMRVFTGATHSARYAVTALKLAIKGLMIATGIGIAIAALTTIIEKIWVAADKAADKLDETAESYNEAAAEIADYRTQVRDLGQLVAKEADKEIAALDKLYKVAKDERKSREERAQAMRDLQAAYPDYFSEIDAEKIKVGELTKGYEDLRAAIIASARAKAAEQKIVSNTAELLDLEQQIESAKKEAKPLTSQYKLTIESERARVYGTPERSAEAMRRLSEEDHVMSPDWFDDINNNIDPRFTVTKIVLSQLEPLMDTIRMAEAKIAEIEEANAWLEEVINSAPAPGSSGGNNTAGGNDDPAWTEDATTLKAITDNISILEDRLQTASIEEAALINQQIANWKAKAEAITNAGKAATDNTPLWKEDAATLQDINNNIAILTQRLQTATVEEAALINQQIASWNAKADAIKNAGKVAETTTAVWNEQADTLKEIGDNIQILESQLEAATLSEAAAINQQIELWNKKADAIRNAGKEAEKTSITTGEGLRKNWGAVKNIGNSIENITEALKGNGNAWQAVVSIIDGFISIYDGIKTIITVIDLLTAASAAHAATKAVEAGAEASAATTRAAAATTNAVSGAAEITTNKLVAASFKELAASEYMAAHAAIPFAGFAIGAGFTSAMLAMTTAAGIPALADGGIASGPTLALVGEYAGASGNPEVIAPLDKLRNMLQPPSGLDLSKVQFEIKGRTLVGILAKENNVNKRS